MTDEQLREIRERHEKRMALWARMNAGPGTITLTEGIEFGKSTDDDIADLLDAVAERDAEIERLRTVLAIEDAEAFFDALEASHD